MEETLFFAIRVLFLSPIFVTAIVSIILLLKKKSKRGAVIGLTVLILLTLFCFFSGNIMPSNIKETDIPSVYSTLSKQCRPTTKHQWYEYAERGRRKSVVGGILLSLQTVMPTCFFFPDFQAER